MAETKLHTFADGTKAPCAQEEDITDIYATVASLEETLKQIQNLLYS